MAATIVRDGSLLAIVQAVCQESGIADAPSAVLSSSEKAIQQILSLAILTARMTRDRHPWKKLEAEHTFTLATSTAAYATPGNFNYELAQTHWNQTNSWRICGPLSPEEWQNDQNNIVTLSLYQNYRIKGLTNTRFYISPTPTSSENGQTCVFEYLSLNCWRPRTWANGQVYTADTYTFYDGVIYSSAGGGTTSGTSPSDDTGVTDWTAYTSAYDYPRADTDVFVIAPDLLQLGAKGYVRRERRLEGYQEDIQEYWDQIDQMFGREYGGTPIDLGRPRNSLWPNIPDTGIMGYSES